jgi:hypothetical protein
LVNCILEDDCGALWISHDHGIYRVAKHALEEVAAGKAASAECVSYGLWCCNSMPLDLLGKDSCTLN